MDLWRLEWFWWLWMVLWWLEMIWVGFDGNWTAMEKWQKFWNLNFVCTRSTTLGGCQPDTQEIKRFNWELKCLLVPENHCTRSTTLAKMSGHMCRYHWEEGQVLANHMYPVNHPCRMSTGHTGESPDLGSTYKGFVLLFHVYPIDMGAIMSTGYTRIRDHLGDRFSISPVYPVNHPGRMSNEYTADSKFQILQSLMMWSNVGPIDHSSGLPLMCHAWVKGLA